MTQSTTYRAPVPRGGRGAFSAGFSLMELIIVLAMISILAGAVAPMFAASVGNIQFRNARNDLIALIEFTQELAVRDSREYRVYIDKKERSYWVESCIEKEGAFKTFAPVEQKFAEKQYLPDYVSITQVKARKSRASDGLFVGCYPNGASDEAQISLADTRERARKVRIEVSGPLGSVRVAKER